MEVDTDAFACFLIACCRPSAHRRFTCCARQQSSAWLWITSLALIERVLRFSEFDHSRGAVQIYRLLALFSHSLICNGIVTLPEILCSLQVRLVSILLQNRFQEHVCNLYVFIGIVLLSGISLRVTNCCLEALILASRCSHGVLLTPLSVCACTWVSCCVSSWPWAVKAPSFILSVGRYLILATFLALSHAQILIHRSTCFLHRGPLCWGDIFKFALHFEGNRIKFIIRNSIIYS